jgi:hypothetical protein
MRVYDLTSQPTRANFVLKLRSNLRLYMHINATNAFVVV